MKTAVIISFYNKIEYLKLVLEGLNNQSDKEFEVLIADDGSKEEVVKELKNINQKYSFPVKHIWHQDKGFRKNKILNRTITKAECDYLIFIDGDCIPHKEFVKEHKLNAKKNYCLTGRRVNLSEKFTKKILYNFEKRNILEINFPSLLIDGIFGKSYDVEKGIYLKNRLLREVINKKSRGILGCNFSIFKDDFLSINGFDERYEAPSIGEDTDIQYRMELKGIKIVSLNNIANQYHLFHKLLPRPQVNLDLFEKVKKSNIFFTPYGINKE